MNRVRMLVAMFACLFSVQLGFGQVYTISPGEFFAEPSTPHCLAFRWIVSGDTLINNAKVTVQYRKTGTTPWLDALPLLRQNAMDQISGGWLPGNLFAGSIMNLTPGTSYECKFHMTDPDNGGTWFKDTSITVSTNTYPPVNYGGQVVHVYPPSWTGTKLSPNYPDADSAAHAAKPGWVIMIHAGVHTGCVTKTGLKGTPAAPIVFRGAGDGEAILQGSDPAVFDTVSQIFYIRNGSTNVVIENLTIRNGLRVIDALGIDGLIFRNCNIYNVDHGIWLGSGSSQAQNCFIMNNKIKGRVDVWNCGYVPYPRGDVTGIVLCGRNQVACFNDISNMWDGITVGYPGAPSDKNHPNVVSIDMYNNFIHECRDDNIETDYSSGNVRVWNNMGINSAHAYSFQPVWGGPIYCFRNFAFNNAAGPLKLHNQPGGVLIFNNTCCSEFYTSGGWTNCQLMNNLYLGWSGSYVLESGSQDSVRIVMDYNGYLNKVSQWNFMIRWYYGSHLIKVGSPNAFWNATHLYEQHGIIVDTTDLVHMYLQDDTTQYDSSDVNFALASATAKPVDKGCVLPNITDGYKGLAPDLGALEYGDAMPLIGCGGGIAGVLPETSPFVMNSVRTDKNSPVLFNESFLARLSGMDNDPFDFKLVDLQGRTIQHLAQASVQRVSRLAKSGQVPNGLYVVKAVNKKASIESLVLKIK